MSDYVLTRRGIAHDLTLSPFKHTVYYNEIDYYTYVFSSQLYLDKFKANLEENRKKTSEKLSKTFKFKVENNVLADILLYKKIEIRGFLIKGKEDYKCLNNIVLNGVNLIQPN